MWNPIRLSIMSLLSSNFLSISKINKVSNKTAAKEISDIPKCRASTKLDCPHITAAAPISPCRSKKKKDRKDKNLVSRICPIDFHVPMDRTSTITPTIPDTSLCESSTMSSGVIFPSHNGQDLPQPKPDPVLVTKAPPSKTKIIPIVVATPNHFKDLRKQFTFLS